VEIAGLIDRGREGGLLKCGRRGVLLFVLVYYGNLLKEGKGFQWGGRQASFACVRVSLLVLLLLVLLRKKNQICISMERNTQLLACLLFPE
jgi:hypothetical protein